MSINKMTNSNHRLAVNLFSKLANEEGNIFFSPYSIQIANAMIYAGARGNNAAMIAKASQFDSLGLDIHEAFQQNLLALRKMSSSGVELAVSNGLWVQNGYAIQQAFKDLLQQHYGANAENVDFRNQTELARNVINEAIKQHTNGLIPELFERGTLSADTIATITNAINFKGIWQYQFSKEQTVDGLFLTKDGEAIQAPIMNQTDLYVPYYSDENIQAVQLPYGEDGTHMLLIKTHQPKEFEQWASKFDLQLLSKVDRGLEHTEDVEVFLPKFEIDASYSLKNTLSELGMASAFNPGADWTGITVAEAIQLSDIIHKAKVKVDEEGTVAAAATGGGFMCLSISATPKPIFNGRSPFIFCIRDADKNILFMGRLENPTA